MKKVLTAVMLILGIAGNVFAQTNTEKIFEYPDDWAKLRFLVDIGQGNKMQIELDQMRDISHIENVDSLIRLFVTDIALFKDSFVDDLTAKRIDYILDTTAARKLRIRQIVPAGSNFAITEGEAAALKLDQDTINFKGTVYAKPATERWNTRYYRLSFFLNDVNEINNYLNAGLNAKVTALRNNVNSRWIPAPNHRVALQADPTISARAVKGFVSGGDYLYGKLSVELQNYKSYFVPSFSLAAGIIFTTRGYFKRDISVSWEPNFLFSKNSEGKLRTYRNDFVALNWGQGFVRDNEPRKESRFLFVASFGYLVHRSGEFYEKNTMRIGAGRLSLFEGKTKIEPGIYFNDLFKGVTPTIRLIQTF